MSVVFLPAISRPTSRNTSTTWGLSRPGSRPALVASKSSRQMRLRNASAIWLRALLCTQRNRTFFFMVQFLVIPAAGPVADITDGKHHRHLDQDPDNRGQRCGRVRAEQGDRHRHRQFKKVARADE